MQDQLNHLATICCKLTDSLCRTPDVNEAKASSTDHRALNVVIHGVSEDKASSIWRDVLAMVLRTAADNDVGVEDASVWDVSRRARPDHCFRVRSSFGAWWFPPVE